MSINLNIRPFLKNHWQKKPLLIRQALPNFQSPVSAEELAGLSMEQDVESRIILEQGQIPWEIWHGPFSEDDFRNLPECKWTLLVQAVDHWFPEVQRLLDYFRFLPRWRIDDVMISYATDGGSVGPHYDYYDVFLLQAQGRRLWKTGPQYNEDSNRIQHPSLKILSEFKTLEEHILEPGDMLYLPPGIGHHGIAMGECITISIGFRAPSHREILMQFTDFVADRLSNDFRYADPNLKQTDNPYLIDDLAIDRVQAILQQYVDNRELLHQWFGGLMTEPKYCADTEETICNNWNELLYQTQKTGLELAHDARIACDQKHFYANGRGFSLFDRETIWLTQRIAQQQELSFKDLSAIRETESRRLLVELVNQTVLIFREQRE